MSLSENQRAAVCHVDGPCLCLAGPGSGKTTVITERTRYLVEKEKISPMEILVITFTKAAAMEMKERFVRLMGGKQVPVTFGTFHSIFFWILRQAYGLTAANILKEEQKYQIFRELIGKLNMEIEDETDFLTGIQGEISLVKNDRIPLEHYYSKNCSEELFRKLFSGYQEQLGRLNKLDFDDMLVLCYELLSQREDILSGWQKRFRYILIDEFQDINQIQYDTIRLLAAPKNNLFIVGDDDQSIYRFRGARPEIMLNFSKDYPEAKQILLGENYRSTENIIRAAGKVIRNNTSRFPKDIRGVREKGGPIELHGFVNQSQENQYLLKKIQEYREQGYSYQDLAVLFRTNTGARLVVEKLMEYNIPFQMRDSMPNLYEHWITKDILTYIAMAGGSRKRQDFLKVMNRPKRYLSRDALEGNEVSFQALRREYLDKDWMLDRIDKFENDLTAIGRMKPFAAINYIRNAVGYEQYLKEYAEFRRIKEEELLEVLNELQEASKSFQNYEDWFRHMEEYQEAFKEQSRQRETAEESVTLTTLHSSKGLEFPVVFIVDANEGIIPHRKAVLQADLEEERRMFYVGMTRAKERLHLYYTKERYGKTQSMSRFLEELRATNNRTEKKNVKNNAGQK